MAIQYSVAVRNAKLDSIETTVGVSAELRILSGPPPANCAAAETGTVLSTVLLPSDWMAAAASGSKAKLGTWEDASADATGVGGYFRVYDNGGTLCGIQGTVTGSGGGGDMEVSNVNFAAGQQFTINTFTLNDNNA